MSNKQEGRIYANRTSAVRQAQATPCAEKRSHLRSVEPLGRTTLELLTIAVVDRVEQAQPPHRLRTARAPRACCATSD